MNNSTEKYWGLFDEKNIGTIWWISRVHSSNRFNLIVPLILLPFLVFCAYKCSMDVAALQVRSIVTLGLNVGIVLLALLVTGFTFIASFCNPGVYVFLASQIHVGNCKHELNYLKYNFFMFIALIFELAVFCFVCLLIFLFAFSGSPITTFIDSIGHCEKSVIVKCVLVALSIFLIYFAMQFKAFLFNIYHVCITAIVWYKHQQDSQSTQHYENQENQNT